jgi:hypothetical protein
MTTLMLEVDDDLFARARQLAEARQMTVSEMLKRLLRVMAEPPLKRNELPPLTAKAVGMPDKTG